MKPTMISLGRPLMALMCCTGVSVANAPQTSGAVSGTTGPLRSAVTFDTAFAFESLLATVNGTITIQTEADRARVVVRGELVDLAGEVLARDFSLAYRVDITNEQDLLGDTGHMRAYRSNAAIVNLVETWDGGTTLFRPLGYFGAADVAVFSEAPLAPSHERAIIGLLDTLLDPQNECSPTHSECAATALSTCQAANCAVGSVSYTCDSFGTVICDFTCNPCQGDPPE